MKKRDELENNLKQNISQKQTPDGFIKVTDNPVSGLTSDQKVILNRKANAMFNNGNIEDARRIFITTGYSDGLTRVGDFYMNQNQSLKALKAYYLAHNKRDSEPIYENIAKVISSLIKETE
ncbi:MAG: hypothetical protein K6D95_04980 [Treponema sp.]|nr:hypothetical protein [Treponema sp.]